MADGQVVPMWGLRDAASPAGTATVPGPTISAVVGDRLIINLTNALPEPTSLVINGQQASEAGAMAPTWTDGTTGSRGGNLNKRVRSFTHEVAPPVVSPGNPTTIFTATYEWANLKAGTYLIASGSHPAVQLPMGLYAALKVDVVAGLQAYPNATTTSYANDVVLLFSEVDPALNAAVVGGEYGTSVYPTSISIGYLPRYFLINGTSYLAGASTPLPAGAVNGTTLLRFLNAGSRTRNPVLQGPFMTLVAEDGNPRSYPQQQYSINLPAGKTMDATFQPTVQGALALYDRSLGLTNNTTSPGGMLVNLGISLGASNKVGVALAGQWYLDVDGNGIWVAPGDLQIAYGSASDTALFGDWDGDGVDTPGIKRGNTYYLRNSNTSGVADISFVFGDSTDTPVVGDWDGNGTETIGIRRGNTYYLRNSNTSGVADVSFVYGGPADSPIVGDWDGDGTDTIGIKRGNFYYLRNSNTSGVADIAFQFGADTDAAVVGDWNSNGSDSVGIYRAATGIFYLRNTLTAGVADTALNFGIVGGTPFVGNW
jgi:hypothetical protein